MGGRKKKEKKRKKNKTPFLHIDLAFSRSPHSPGAMVTQQALKSGSASPSTEMEAGTAGSLHCLFPRVRELGLMTTQNKDDILSPPSLLGSNLLLSSSKGDMHGSAAFSLRTAL